jgi:hypothetical protein
VPDTLRALGQGEVHAREVVRIGSRWIGAPAVEGVATRLFLETVSDANPSFSAMGPIRCRRAAVNRPAAHRTALDANVVLARIEAVGAHQSLSRRRAARAPVCAVTLRRWMVAAGTPAAVTTHSRANNYAANDVRPWPPSHQSQPHVLPATAAAGYTPKESV